MYREQYRGYASTVSGFEQAVLREFMRSGRFETHVNRMRNYYRTRRKTLVDALGPLSSVMEILGAPAGHHLPLCMHGVMDEAQLIHTARGDGSPGLPRVSLLYRSRYRSVTAPPYCWALAASPMTRSGQARPAPSRLAVERRIS